MPSSIWWVPTYLVEQTKQAMLHSHTHTRNACSTHVAHTHGTHAAHWSFTRVSREPSSLPHSVLLSLRDLRLCTLSLSLSRWVDRIWKSSFSEPTQPQWSRWVSVWEISDSVQSERSTRSFFSDRSLTLLTAQSSFFSDPSVWVSPQSLSLSRSFFSLMHSPSPILLLPQSSVSLSLSRSLSPQSLWESRLSSRSFFSLMHRHTHTPRGFQKMIQIHQRRGLPTMTTDPAITRLSPAIISKISLISRYYRYFRYYRRYLDEIPLLPCEKIVVSQKRYYRRYFADNIDFLILCPEQIIFVFKTMPDLRINRNQPQNTVV